MSSPHPSPSKPLAARDVNTTSPSKIKDVKPTSEGSMGGGDLAKPKSMEYHRQVLKSRIEDDKQNRKYVSPSDTIMSPCTAKLSAYKNKQFTKGKPQSLFGKMEASKKAAAATSVSLDEGKGRENESS